MPILSKSKPYYQIYRLELVWDLYLEIIFLREVDERHRDQLPAI